MHEFHPSNLSTLGSKFRESLRYKRSFAENATERLNKAHSILTDALQKHGEETLTKKNFDKVAKHMEEDHRWKDLSEDARTEFGNALRTELEIPIQKQEHAEV